MSGNGVVIGMMKNLLAVLILRGLLRERTEFTGAVAGTSALTTAASRTATSTTPLTRATALDSVWSAVRPPRALGAERQNVSHSRFTPYIP